MMIAKKIIRFLGGIPCAIMLIGSMALFVMVGTIIESRTDSHQYASAYTYSHPFFSALLCGFFINILVSALRRWPFQAKHIPFLLTHLGLLMILAGALYKNYAGIQGNMGMMEGSGSQDIFLPYTYAIKVEKKTAIADNANLEALYALRSNIFGQFDPVITSQSHAEFPELNISLMAFSPHSNTFLETWIKGNQGFITGINPFPIYSESDIEKHGQLPVSTRIRMHHAAAVPWSIIALSTAEVLETAERAYLEGLEIVISNPITQQVIYKGALSQALSEPIKWANGDVAVTLHFDYSQIAGFAKPHLDISYKSNDISTIEGLTIPLTGSNALKNQHVQSAFLGALPIAIDLVRKEPLLVILQDIQGDVFFYAYDAYGQVANENYHPDELNSLIVYDEGFGGYGVHYKLPFGAYPASRTLKAAADMYQLTSQLRQGVDAAPSLSPPLELFRRACQKCDVDFTNTFLKFSSLWNSHHGWLFSESVKLPPDIAKVMQQLNWQPYRNELKAAHWASALFAEIEPKIAAGADLFQLLEERGWPLLAELKETIHHANTTSAQETVQKLTALTQQLFAAADHLPDAAQNNNIAAERQAHYYSAFLRAFSLHLSDLTSPNEVEDSKNQLETYLAVKLLYARIEGLIMPLKVDNNQDLVQLISSFPENSATLKQIKQAYRSFLQLRKDSNFNEDISQGQLVTELYRLAPLNESHLGLTELDNLEADLSAGLVTLETPLTKVVEETAPRKKMESNVPLVVLKISNGEKTEVVTLPYDLVGQGIKWPVLSGEYTVRFQPLIKTIPYRIRLRQARQINYANSFQPYSFESDILIYNGTEATPVEKILSMNQVYETWEGYRFYLSNIAPANDGAVKHVQIIVNLDPGKYWLTYPGALILTLGIISLFWMKSYASKKRLR